jgi:hypothetical protein
MAPVAPVAPVFAGGIPTRRNRGHRGQRGRHDVSHRKLGLVHIAQASPVSSMTGDGTGDGWRRP